MFGQCQTGVKHRVIKEMFGFSSKQLPIKMVTEEVKL
jgi:hypothetical protein